MLIKQQVDKEKEKIVDKLKDDYLDLQQEVSELRRNGKGTEIVEVMLLEIPAKIKTATINLEDNDINIAKKSIEDIRKETNEIKNGSDFEHMKEMLENAFEDLRKDEKNKAFEKYNDIMKIYPLLTKAMKQTVFSACMELRKRLMKND
jgi:hypothetical protein